MDWESILKLYFRTDASLSIGFGHVVRCLGLAKEMRKSLPSLDIQFIVRNDPRAVNIITAHGYAILALDIAENEERFLLRYFARQRPAIIVFDSLVKYDISTITRLSEIHKTVLIHSYSDARFHSSMSIYPAGHLEMEFIRDLRWQKCSARLISGIEYSLLNENISNVEPKTSINTPPRIISIIAGGTDPTDSLIKIYEWMKESYEEDAQVLFLYGVGSRHAQDFKDMPSHSKIEFREFTLESCLESDLAICAFGVSVYELTYMNIPILTFGHTRKHAEASRLYAERYRCAYDLGESENFTRNAFMSTFERLFHDAETLSLLHKNAHGMVDGNGTKRVSKLLQEMIYEIE